jgi:glycoprotein endo-alpha-1,2-mannosidase
MWPLRCLLACAAAALVLPAAAAPAAAPKPVVAAFYYPWYGTPAFDGGYRHWNQNGHTPPDDIASSYYPAGGIYSSSNPAVLKRQLDEIAGAGITEIVVSWWGKGSFEDQRLPAVQAAAAKDGIVVAAHIEPYPGRTVASVVADIGYLRSLGITSFYIYRPFDLPAGDWAPGLDSLHGVQVFAQTALVGLAATGHFDGVYTYDILTYGGNIFARLCAQAHAKELECAPSVGPGYDAQRGSGDPHTKPRRNGATYDSMWKAAIAAKPDFVTITSFNEWHEGTQIEPAAPAGRHDAYRYLGYNGAFGCKGLASERAYVESTEHWSDLFRGVPLPGHGGPSPCALSRQHL